MFAEDEARVLASEARTRAELDAMVARRIAGQPLEQVVGWAELCGLRVAVDPGVFVPRRRSEHLVHQAVALTRPTLAARPLAAGPLVVVDLCCGSGAVGLAVAAALSPAVPVELHAVDVDPAAVRCARRNLAAVGMGVGVGGRVYEGDLDEPLPATLQGRVDLLVANAPYVPTGDIVLLPAEARDHEPRSALDGGPDGLDVVRRVVAAAPRWLAPGGQLLVETSAPQASRAADAVTRAGLVPRVVTSPDLDATAVVATRPPAGDGPPPLFPPR